MISRSHPHRLGDGAPHSLGSEAWEARAATPPSKLSRTAQRNLFICIFLLEKNDKLPLCF